jgi:PAP2 superfamily
MTVAARGVRGISGIVRWDGWRTYFPAQEFVLMLAFGLFVTVIGWINGLTLVLPSLSALSFTGMSPLAPLSCLLVWGVMAYALPQKGRMLNYGIAFLIYMAIIVFHFNLKLWMTQINPRLWDQTYWQMDNAIRPLIEASFTVHRLVDGWTGIGDRLYLFAFLAMFACSVIVHSFGPLIIFRRVVFAAMLVHVLGGIAYLIMPAIGPFMFEPGLNPIESVHQDYMLSVYGALKAGGEGWLATNGARHLFGGPAAMPSLHVASSAVFVIYALRHRRWLGWFYLPLFFFIWAEAIATRWHYAIDLVVGLGLTCFCVMLSELILRERAPASAINDLIDSEPTALQVQPA